MRAEIFQSAYEVVSAAEEHHLFPADLPTKRFFCQLIGGTGDVPRVPLEHDQSSGWSCFGIEIMVCRGNSIVNSLLTRHVSIFEKNFPSPIIGSRSHGFIRKNQPRMRERTAHHCAARTLQKDLASSRPPTTVKNITLSNWIMSARTAKWLSFKHSALEVGHS